MKRLFLLPLTLLILSLPAMDQADCDLEQFLVKSDPIEDAISQIAQELNTPTAYLNAKLELINMLTRVVPFGLTLGIDDRIKQARVESLKNAIQKTLRGIELEEFPVNAQRRDTLLATLRTQFTQILSPQPRRQNNCDWDQFLVQQTPEEQATCKAELKRRQEGQ